MMQQPMAMPMPMPMAMQQQHLQTNTDDFGDFEDAERTVQAKQKAQADAVFGALATEALGKPATNGSAGTGTV